MKQEVKILVALFVASAGVGYGDLVINDNFESYTAGTSMNGQGGWVVTAATQNSTAKVVSGGSGFDGGSGQSVLVDDNDVVAANARLGYAFSPTDAGGVFQFDYRPGTDVVQKPVVQVMGTKAGAANVVAGVYLLLSNSGTVQSYKAGVGFTDLGATLSADEWYRITLTVHEVSGSADKYDVKILDTNLQTVVSATGLDFSNNLSDITSLYFSFNSAGSSSDFSIDNVTTIPEPATLGLMGLGTVGIMFFRRSRRKI